MASLGAHGSALVCGIAGLVDAAGLAAGWERDLVGVVSAIVHRGPDDEGYLTDLHEDETPDHLGSWRRATERAPRVAFAHRRLSIIDLSEAARQPMSREGGRVFITYNGEVYNFLALRKELEGEGARFRTESDTEVVLEAYLRWGIDCVKRLRGIFAFAISDLRNGKVFLVRDHLGVKPLYYARTGTRWVFSSELKAFSDLPGCREADPSALRKYLHFLWIPGEDTGLARVRKLAPGSWMEVDLGTGSSRVETFWDPLQVRAIGPYSAAPEDQIEYLRAELSRVVTEQMVADVPLGAFLSGGLDSSLVVALMQTAAGQRVSTYSVGYAADDLAYDIVPDDLPYARDVSNHFGTRSTEIVLSPDVAALLPKIVETLDEPLGDPAAISSYLISKAAKQTLTVMLSGMGADEVFGGYPRQRALLYGRSYRALPRWLRSSFAHNVERLPGAGKGFWARAGRAGKKFVRSVEGDSLTHYISMETYFSSELQAQLLNLGGDLARSEDRVPAEVRRLRDRVLAVCPDDPLRQAILWDLVTYLPNLNLAYTDRTSMAHGVEVRVPFLDIKLVEWSLGLRSRDLIRWRAGRLEGKWLLKQAANTLLPKRIIHRKKAGFGAPVRAWLRRDLKEMRHELLGPSGLTSRGWFDPAAVQRMQDDFLAGRTDYSLQIWMLMSLELWARRFL